MQGTCTEEADNPCRSEWLGVPHHTAMQDIGESWRLGLRDLEI